MLTIFEPGIARAESRKETQQLPQESPQRKRGMFGAITIP